MTARRRITIISGFLGSGKTTLLKRLLDREFARGVTPHVIMSEFGDFDIDGQIIADERLQVMAVTAGCICCSSRDELSDALKKLLNAPSGAPVYIETTGVAEPAGVLQAVLPLLRESNAYVSRVLVVYDVSRHGVDGRDAILIEKQLMTADWIVANKTDLAAGNLEGVMGDLGRVNPRAAIVPAVKCAINLDEAVAGETASFAGARNQGHDDHAYESFAFKIDKRLRRTAFEAWLHTLPEAVLRLKGFVRFEGENGVFAVQMSRGQVNVIPFASDRWIDGALVAVTRPLPADTLVKGLNECVAPEA